MVSDSICQTDTEFWFVAPEVWDGHDDDPIVLRFAAFDAVANVTVSQPANANFPTQNVNIAVNGIATLNLTPWLDIIENKPVNTVLNYGLHITSDSPITAYYELNSDENPDIFTLKGSSALGTSFMTPFQSLLNNNYTQSTAAIDVVATEPNTEITIVPSVAFNGHPANVPFTITLDVGETYACRAASTAANQHPGGTTIDSSAPIAVTVSDDSVVGSPFVGTCFDLIGDQLIPISIAGDEYIAVKGAQLNGADRVYVLATEDNTEIAVNGTVMGTWNAGETYTHLLGAGVAYYTTSAPVLVLHMTGVGCEVGAAILPPLRCTGSKDVAFMRSTNASFSVNLLVQSGSEDSFTYNGAEGIITADDFFDVPGAVGVWKYAQITNTGFIGTLSPSRVQNPDGYFHLGVINGTTAGYCRYGYFSEFNEYTYQTYTTDVQWCEGETAILYAEPIAQAIYEWTGPNGYYAIGSDNEVSVGPLVPEDSGFYVVNGSVEDCVVLPDSLELIVTPLPPAPSIEAPETICGSEDLVLICTTPASSWTWNGPNGLIATTDSICIIPNVDPDSDQGLYTVSASNEECSSEITAIDITIYPTVQVDLLESSVEGCIGSVIEVVSETVLSNGSFVWTYPNGSTASGGTLLLENVQLSDIGWYLLGGTESGCAILEDSVEITVVEPSELELTLPEFVCSDGSSFTCDVNDPDPGIWSASCGNCMDASSGTFDPSLAASNPVSITYESLGTCPQVIQEALIWIETPNPSISGIQSACLGEGVINWIPEVTGGNWAASCGGCMSPSGYFDTELAGEGNWTITHSLGGDCPSTFDLSISVTPNLNSTFTALPLICQNENPVMLIPENEGGVWTANCGNCISQNGSFNPAFASVGTQEVTYTITGSCGSSTTLPVNVLSIPNADFSVNPSTGCVPMLVALTAPLNINFASCYYSITNVSGETSYIDGCDVGYFTADVSGCYEVVRNVTDNQGCSQSWVLDNAICAGPAPSSAFLTDPVIPSLYESQMTCTVQEPEGSNTYEWTLEGTPQGNELTWSIELALLSSNPFAVCLKATDLIGCDSQTCKDIQLQEGLLVFAPNAFTPDQDGHNDAWHISTSGDVVSLEVRVFNRWGQLVFESHELEHWWTGSFMDGTHFSPDGLYTWEAIVRDSAYGIRYLQGHVALIR